MAETLKLQPGDHLIYSIHSWYALYDYVIMVKTWSPAVHIEIYAGEGQSVASRNGIGVNIYPYRSKSLAYVLRPNQSFDFYKGMNWFYDTAKGQKYDWKGLLCFILAVKSGSSDKMFCSEFALNFDRASDLLIFNPHWSADKTAPGNFLMVSGLTTIYDRKKDKKNIVVSV